MASIQTKGNMHYVVVSKKNPDTGKYDSDWIPFETYESAEKFKGDIEDEKRTAEERAKSITNATRTVEELIWQYVELVGKVKWGLKTYPSYVARINNYIIPLIEGLKVWECTTLRMDEFFTKLQQTHAIRSNKKVSDKLITTKVVHEIHKFMKAMFNCVVEWGFIDRNPCKKPNRTIVKHKPQKRAFWTHQQYIDALKLCAQIEDYMLLTIIILAVGTAVREGEICGLQWDRVHISDEDIERKESRVFIDREVARVEKYMLKQKPQDVLYVFPDIIRSSTSSMVLKIPKSDTSSRTIFLPETVTRFLRMHRVKQQKLKEFLGDAYQDHNLVFALDDGRPMENKVLYNKFVRFIEACELPKVVFHSIRHTSTTYMLITAQGDIKSVQGNTGHADGKMIVDVYAEVVDDERKVHAQKLDREYLTDDVLLKVLDRFENGENNTFRENSTAGSDELLKALMVLQGNPEELSRILGIAENGM